MNKKGIAIVFFLLICFCSVSLPVTSEAVVTNPVYYCGGSTYCVTGTPSQPRSNVDPTGTNPSQSPVSTTPYASVSPNLSPSNTSSVSPIGKPCFKKKKLFRKKKNFKFSNFLLDILNFLLQLIGQQPIGPGYSRCEKPMRPQPGQQPSQQPVVSTYPSTTGAPSITSAPSTTLTPTLTPTVMPSATGTPVSTP